MKVLLDENLTPKLLRNPGPHEVMTEVYADFGSLTNGALLTAAEAAGFEVFLTGDTKLPTQQKLEGRSIAVVVLTAHQWSFVQPSLNLILEAIGRARPATLQLVNCGRFSRKRQQRSTSPSRG